MINNGGFVMSFEVRYGGQDGKELASGATERYPINQTKTVDMEEAAGIRPGSLMHPRIAAVAGGTKDGPPVEYTPNGQTATYIVTGTTFSIEVALT